MNRELPPLPPPENEADTDGCTYACPEGFSEQQMTAYAAQAVAAERERWIAKAGAAYTDAHAIFNDPPSEAPQVVRDVIEWHLHTMRTEVTP